MRSPLVWCPMRHRNRHGRLRPGTRRRCAAFVGLKVTHGRVPLSGVHPLVSVSRHRWATSRARSRTSPIVALRVSRRWTMRPIHGAIPWSAAEPVVRPRSPDSTFADRATRCRVTVARATDPATRSTSRFGGVRGSVSGHQAQHSSSWTCREPRTARLPRYRPAIGPEIIAVHGERYSRPSRSGTDPMWGCGSNRQPTATAERHARGPTVGLAQARC